MDTESLQAQIQYWKDQCTRYEEDNRTLHQLLLNVRFVLGDEVHLHRAYAPHPTDGAS